MTDIGLGSVIIACPWYKQLLLSVTVKLYVPAFRAIGLFPPQFSIYGAVPPNIFNDALPSDKPEQLTLNVSTTTLIWLGWVINTESVNTHPFVSVMMNICVPALRASGLLVPQSSL